MSEDNKEKKEIEADIKRTIISISMRETVIRFGTANAEFFKGYSGVDKITGRLFSKGLRDISNSKLHPDYLDQNLKQQAGYAAEIVATSRDNANAIISESPIRSLRSDDTIEYGRNHNVVDRVKILDGEILEGSQSQMKFVSKRNELFNKIAGEGKNGKSDLSRYRGVKLELPSEQFEGAESFCRTRAQRLRMQADIIEHGRPDKAARLREMADTVEGNNPGHAEHLRRKADRVEAGQPHEAAKLRREADNYDQLAGNVQDSGLTTEEAIFYRKHPKIATALDIARTSHKAGLEGAKYGVVIGGCISLLTNAFAVAQERKQLGEAVADVVVDAAKGGALGYGAAFVGSALKGSMEQSGNEMLRNLAVTGAPVLALNVCLSLSSSIRRYACGEINEVELLEEVGEKGAGMLSSAMMAALGQLAIPVPFVGAAIGGMIGYTMSSMFYRSALDAARQADMAQKRLIRVRDIEKEARAEVIRQRQALSGFMQSEFPELFRETEQLFAAIDNHEGYGMDEVSVAINAYAELLGAQLQFKTQMEFDDFMLNSDQPLVLNKP